MKYAVGADIGGTSVKIGIFHTDGTLLEKWEIPTRVEEHGKNILSDIGASIRTGLEQAEIKTEEVCGIGLGVPGPVGKDGTVYKCANLGWGICNPIEEMKKIIDIPVKVANDANAAALGEMWQGSGRGHRDLVMITLGTGIGSGIIIDGKILNGTNGSAGEIGHINITEKETDVCGCGKRGCMEQFASANGIVRCTERYLSTKPEIASSLRLIKDFSCKDIFREAARGDVIADTMVSEAGYVIGKGLAIIANIINPEVFVIGGGVSQAGDLLLNPIKEFYKEFVFHAAKDTEIKLAELGNEAGIYGCAKMAID